MTDGRRMSTDRFYGGIENRLEILADFLSLLDDADAEVEGVSNERSVNWFLTNTNAEERSAIERHLNFIESIGLIECDDNRYKLTRIGNCYLWDRDPLVLYNCLRTGVKGFDTIVRMMAIEPRTDDELMELLISEFEECDMGTSEVAKRHREWLQVIGYVERVDNRNCLTDSGEVVADQLRGISNIDLETGSIYERRELHSKYGGSTQGGIAPSNDDPVVFLFTGGTGEEHGYHDEFLSDKSVIYTGEGQTGDMEMKRGNRVIRDHVEEGRELHLFEMEGEGVRYVGQFMYAGHFFEELPDSEGELRRGIRFKLTPIDDTTRLDTPLHTNAVGVTDEYETLDSAINDVRNRLSESGEGTTWLKNRIGQVIIEDWSTALGGFNPADDVSGETAEKFDQIRGVYRTLETEFETKAEELGVGSLGAFTPAQTLFLCWLRIVQEELDIPRGSLNQPRLNSILNGAYTATDPVQTEPPKEVSHPILTHIREHEPDVYKLTGPPDYWLTTVEYGSVSFEDRHEKRWKELEAGDVALLHSRAQPSNDEFDAKPNGLIGVGIVGETFKKDKAWWWDEHAAGDGRTYTMVASFDRLFLTCDVEAIDTSRGITDKDPSKINRELNALTEGCLPTEQANEICATTSGTEFPAQGMFARFRTDADEIDHNRPLALLEAMANDLTEVAAINPHKTYDGSLPTEILDGLHFPNDLGERILEQISTAIRSGKHVLLTGPPGTGKTEIAERVCEYLATQSHPYLYSGFQMTTSTADWSTFDTVGGYMPGESDNGGEGLAFTSGIVLNRLKASDTGVQSNELIVIDELNRADIDKAFGQLFTLLSGQSVQLPYTVEGKEVELTTYEDVEGVPSANQYVVPNSWRIFATMNAYDKTSLYEMSYAFMRRFAFIRVPAPELPEGTDGERTVEDIVFAYAGAWDLEISRSEAWAVGRVWQETNQTIEERAIGPAIIEDLLRYVTQHPEEELEYHLTQAVISYVFPQLEGVPKRKRIVREIASVREIDSALIESAAREMLQVTVSENE